ncbi:PDC sensor domain-containing protein [Oricola cellulosilytica]|uniref:DUF2291 family protein n=1 Tax=Oricola cellulosilytica TaxID=1429082 RepID=A0A4R0P5S9_9HYPH|nr:PDC sensor domain-containing protein [Oricola cellulosilytica]TCD12283.1 hypothetical protein E0D97_14760 [Oricola cellulosilytica]
MKTIKIILAASALAIAGNPAQAEGPHVPAVKEFIQASVMPWLKDPAVIAAVKAQNEANSGLSEEEIVALDNKWRAGVDGGDKSLIDNVLSNSLSAFLRDKQMASSGVITEVFVMDAKGLNVGQSDVTSDYWQGDEAKWQKTYGASDANAIFVDEAEKDESTQMLQSQASMTVTDEGGAPIGAVTVGVNLNSL